jgi:hypothetical protein
MLGREHLREMASNTSARERRDVTVTGGSKSDCMYNAAAVCMYVCMYVRYGMG